MSKKKSKGGNTAAIVSEMAQPIAEKLGMKIWDVTYEKEGSLYYLRVFIERPGGSIGIDDCENMSRPLSELLDKADPIEEQYILEVGSPGLGRIMRKKEHFEEYTDCPVRIRYIREHDGLREFIAIIRSYDDDNGILSVETENGSADIDLSETAFVRLYDDEEFEE
ncbi:MAG: ribosome maturation factor RimP [Oscillospiraceae bacterium]|nr:ribosome maturation factor RimP [Oscillospiraceae bacterium]